MAYFLTAYNKTAKNEGGYANDPLDAGGETWKGIARKFHPKWKGWQIVDTYRPHSEFPKVLYAIPGLQKQVYEFYKNEFWNRIRGDEINKQPVADSIYDSAVNMGISAAVKLAQRAAGIAETGQMDDDTLNILNNDK